MVESVSGACWPGTVKDFHVLMLNTNYRKIKFEVLVLNLNM